MDSGTLPGRHRRRRSAAARRPGLLLGVAVAGAIAVNVLASADPPARAAARTAESVLTSQQEALAAPPAAPTAPADTRSLEELATSRSNREAAVASARQVQVAAEQSAQQQRKAEAEAADRAAQQKAAAAAAASKAAGSTTATRTAHITNSAGPVRPQTQAAADAVVSNVPGADGITLGGTRPDTLEPMGHPAGLAVDYMVLSDTALGEAIVAYHIAHWAEFRVSYIIFRQRILMSPNGAWQAMEDRGSPTANHMDHVHVNYLP